MKLGTALSIHTQRTATSEGGAQSVIHSSEDSMKRMISIVSEKDTLHTWVDQEVAGEQPLDRKSVERKQRYLCLSSSVCLLFSKQVYDYG